jgi:CRISPR-associated endonuclease/helicase Cas3
MNSPDEPVAHIAQSGRIHPLFEHLKKTAELAAEFAEELNASEWARLAGLWHDMGKYSGEFQAHIRGKPGRVDHSTCGAVKACETFDVAGRILAYIIAGHHAGLPDWQTEASGMSGLAQRLDKRIPTSHPPEDLLTKKLPLEKPRPGTDPSMWIRMLFSCVVDADFLDTEASMEPDRGKIRGRYPALDKLLPLFSAYMEKKTKEANPTEVNAVRAEILKQCVSMASEKPSIFSLTVPTGGGKTLSSMAFTLNHALKYSKRRIIYVIPYTSIIEQTADQFKDIFGDTVLEHHSNINIPETEDETFRKSKLASENWDAPIVVTTTVQFFESLYASRPSRCRKLHNIVNSVVILDEAQLLPPDLLNPILKALTELHKNYGVTLLLSTATQPAFGPHSSDFSFEGLPDMKEIIEDPKSLHEKLKRVKVNVPTSLSSEVSWEELAMELSGFKTVLCIVNKRDDCRKLYRLMPEDTVHLSALMCGAHRSKVIAEVKQRLKDGVPTRVVSTQLVEAGVDLDFPVVYRAIAGLDSIAQAAGRCNREGLLKEGEVFVFVPQSKTPPGILRQAAEIGRRLLDERVDDPLAPEQFTAYFKELYWIHGDRLDAKGILADLAPDSQLRFSFRTAAEKFHIIDESQYAPAFVRYDEGEELVNLLLNKGPQRWLMRKLQRYVVNIPKYVLNILKGAMEIEEPFPGIYIQSNMGRYDEALGLIYDEKEFSPDDLIV